MDMIRVLVQNAQEALDFKQQVLNAGLILHEDFTWEYQPNLYDVYHDSSHAQPEVRFTFRDPAHETFFSMRFE